MLADLTLLLDGNFFLHRSLNVPDLASMFTEGGVCCGGVLGFLKSMGKTISAYPANKVVVIWDGGLSARRREIAPDYKKKPPRPGDYKETFYASQRSLREASRFFGAHSISLSGKEGDDVIGWYSQSLMSRVGVVSRDSDMLQLVRKNVFVYQQGGSKEREVNFVNFLENVTVPVDKFVLWKSIVGDKQSDNIPGVYGVGPATATAIVNEMEGTTLGELGALTKLTPKNSRWSAVAENLKIVEKNIKLIDISQEEFTATEVQQMSDVLLHKDIIDVRSTLDFLRSWELFGLNIIGESDWESRKTELAQLIVSDGAEIQKLPDLEENHRILDEKRLYIFFFPFVHRFLAGKRISI